MNAPLKPQFSSERELVDCFCEFLQSGESALGTIPFATEFDYRRGRADVIAALRDLGKVFSFEAKLSRWRDALHQASK